MAWITPAMPDPVPAPTRYPARPGPGELQDLAGLLDGRDGAAELAGEAHDARDELRAGRQPPARVEEVVLEAGTCPPAITHYVLSAGSWRAGLRRAMERPAAAGGAGARPA